MNKSLEELKQIVANAPGQYWRNPDEKSGYSHLISDLRRIVELEEENQRLRERCSDLEANLVEFNGLVIESEGVAGYHSNGDVAYWDEFDFASETPIVAADDYQRKIKAQGIREVVSCVEHIGKVTHCDKRDSRGFNIALSRVLEFANKLERGE